MSKLISFNKGDMLEELIWEPFWFFAPSFEDLVKFNHYTPTHLCYKIILSLDIIHAAVYPRDSSKSFILRHLHLGKNITLETCIPIFHLLCCYSKLQYPQPHRLLLMLYSSVDQDIKYHIFSFSHFAVALFSVIGGVAIPWYINSLYQLINFCKMW